MGGEVSGSSPPPALVPQETQVPAQGWYQDPNGSGLRWWDGSGWTDHVHGDASPAAAEASSQTFSDTTFSAAASPKKGGSSVSDMLNSNPVPVLLALALVLALVVVLFVL